MLQNHFMVATLFLTILLQLSLAFDAASLLSGNQKKGLEEYKRAIGVEVSGNNNSALAEFNDSFLKQNRCFKKIAQNFYSEIRKNDVAGQRNTKRAGRPSDAPSYSIDDQGPEIKALQGDFWQRALKHSGGDKNLAMSLVGVCGHDNLIQSSEIVCPTEFSSIYAPGSLGAEADISPEMQRKVLNAQGDNGSGLYVPYKYYHTLGAASTSCLLLRRGVPAIMAQTIVTTAVNGYRSGRLCEAFLNPGFSPFKGSDRDGLAQALKDGEGSSAWQSMVSKISGLAQKSKDVQKNKLQIALSHLDAQNHFISNPLIMSECAKNKMSGRLVADLKTLDLKSQKVCPQTMPADRCERLKKRIETWAVDREWTEAQHLAGFRFAQKNCPADIVADDQIESTACAVLDRGTPGSTEIEN